LKTVTQYEKYQDAIALFNYCFENFSSVTMSTAQFDNNVIPVYDGDRKTADVKIKARDIDIIRPSTLAKADIKARLSVPPQYEKGDEIKPTVNFYDKSDNLLSSAGA
jgi:D-alanyl-D-alanine carboxypeptidase